ncbi:unnamed protein product [Withania somnifera]
MDLKGPSRYFLPIFLVVIGCPSVASLAINPPYPKAISDLKESIVKGLGFQAEDFKISGFDLKDALVGRSVSYEFDVEVDNKVIPLKLLEDVNRWEFVDLPIFRVERGEENGLIERRSPMELWIQDAKDMRISLPHDVDAGELRKVILADGTVATVKGARSVSLRHPVELPLPFNRTTNGFASGLLALAEYLRQASLAQGGTLLSLRIVGPTSLISPASPSSASANRLKLKRLAPGLVELSSVSKLKAMDAISAIDLLGETAALLTPNQFTTLWPIRSINGSNSNLLGFEALLCNILGPKAGKKSSFKLLKADILAQTFVKIGFGVEKKLKEGDGFNWEGYPEWRTKPESVRMHFEVLAKVDGDKVVPERVVQVDPITIEDTVAPSVLLGKVSMSKDSNYSPTSKSIHLVNSLDGRDLCLSKIV